jgi:hypothetical protein
MENYTFYGSVNNEDDEDYNENRYYMYGIINMIIVLILLWWFFKNYFNSNKTYKNYSLYEDDILYEDDGFRVNIPSQSSYNSTYGNFPILTTNLNPSLNNFIDKLAKDTNAFKSKPNYLIDNFNTDTKDDAAALMQSAVSNTIPYRDTGLKGGLYGDVPVYFYNNFDKKNISLWHQQDSGNYLINSTDDWKVINYAKEMPQWEARENYVYDP